MTALDETTAQSEHERDTTWRFPGGHAFPRDSMGSLRIIEAQVTK